MNEDMRTLTTINMVGMAYFSMAMAIIGDYGITAVAFISALINAIVLFQDDKEKKETV